MRCKVTVEPVLQSHFCTGAAKSLLHRRCKVTFAPALQSHFCTGAAKSKCNLSSVEIHGEQTIVIDVRCNLYSQELLAMKAVHERHERQVTYGHASSLRVVRRGSIVVLFMSTMYPM